MIYFKIITPTTDLDRTLAKRKTTKKTRPKRQFNAPFAGLKKSLAKRVDSQPQSEPKPAAPVKKRRESDIDDADLFLREVGPVKPVGGSAAHSGAEPAPRSGRKQAAPEAVSEDLEVMTRLAELVDGQAPIELRYTDEYVEGFARELNPGLCDKLRLGEFPVQDYIDLHGLSLEEAMDDALDFFRRARVQGLRSVLVVHGRGLGSAGQVPVIKSALARWLTSRALRRHVLGFCTARADDGGTGAMYVLLTRWTARSG